MTRLPIRELSPVLGVQWEVVARIAFLSPVRQWSNANGRGQVMNAELVDAEGSRICACAFNNDAKNLATILRGDGVFLFAGGRIRKAARGFGKPNHTYEIVLSSSTSVTPVKDDNSIEHVDYAFTTIRDLAHADVHAQVDILAMIMDVGVLDSVVDRKGGVQVKRELKLTDSSNVEIVCTLWNEFAEVDYTAALHQPYAFRQVMVNDFRGRSLSTLSYTMVVSNPKLPEVVALQGWFDDTRGEFSVPISLVDCKFTSLKDVATQPNGTSVSVIGVIVRVDKPDDVTAKDGRLLRKRTVALQDMSDTQVECTLWQAEVDKVSPDQLGRVLSLENAKVVIYGDCRVATSVKTLVLVDPAIPACFELVRWYTTPPHISADEDGKGNKSNTTADEDKQSTSPQQLQVATDAALEHSLRGSIGNAEPATLRSHSLQATPSAIAADKPGTPSKKHSPQATPSPIAANEPGTPSKKPKKRERGSSKEADNLMPMILLLVLMALSLAGGGIGLDAAEHDAAIGSFLRERSSWQPMCLYTFDDPDIGSTIANRVPGGACPFEALQPDNQLVSNLNTATSFWQLGVHLAEAPNNDTTRVQLSSVSSVSAREFFTVAAVRNDSVSGSGVTFEMVIRRRAKSNQSMTLFSIANEYDNCVDAGFRLDLNEHQVLAFIYFVPVLEDGGEAGVEACYEQRLFSVDTSAACQLPPLLEPVERTPAVQITVTLDPSSDRGHWKTDFYMSYTDAETMKRVDCVVHDEQHPPNAQVLNNLIEGRYKLYLGNSPRNVSSPRKRKRLAPVREFQLLGNSSGLNATERLRAMLKQKLMSISGPRLPKAMRIFGDNSLSLKILGITFPPLNEDTPLAYLRSKMTDFKERYGDQIVDYLVDLVQKKASKTVVGQRDGDILTPAGQNIDMGSAFSRSALYQGAGGATFDLFHFAIYRRVVTEEQVNSITRQLLLPSRQFPSSQQTMRASEDSLVLLNLTMLHGVFDDLRLELRGLPEFGRLLLFPSQTVVTASNLNVFRELPLEYQHHIFFRPEPDQNNENLPLPNPVAFSRRLQPYASVRFGVADSLAGRVVNRSAEARIDVFVDAVNDAPRPRKSELETPVRVGVPVILNLEGDDIDGAPAASSANGEVSDASGFLSSFSFTNATDTTMNHQLLKIVRMPKFGKLFDCNTTCDTMRFAEEHELESTRVYRNSVDTKTANLSTTLTYIYYGWGRKNLGENETGLVVDELWYRLSDGDPGIFSDVSVVRFVLVGGTSTADGNVLATIRVGEDSIRVLDLGELDPLTPFFNSKTRFEFTVLPRHGNLFQLNDVNESDTAATAENATRCVSRERIGARIKTTGTIVSDPFGRVIYVPKLDYSSLDPRFPFARDDDGDFFEYKVISTPANKDSLVVHAKSPAALFTNGSVARRVRLEVVNVPDNLVVLPPFAFTANSSSLDTVPAPVTFEDPDSINSDQLYQVNVEAADGTSAIALGFAITDDDVMAECPYERPCVLIWSTNGTRLTTSSNNTRDSELSFHITTQLFDPSHIEVTGTVAALNTALAALSIRDLSGVSSNVAHTSGFKLWVKRLGAGVEDEATTATFTIKFPGDATSVSSSSGNLVPALNSQLERYVSTLLFLLAGWVVLSNGSCISFGFCCSRARKKRRRKFEQKQRRFREQAAQNDYEYSVLLMSLADMVLQPDLLVSVCLLKSCVRSTDRVKETEVLMQAFILRSLLPVLESERQGARFVFKLMALEHSEGIASVQGSGSIFQRRPFWPNIVQLVLLLSAGWQQVDVGIVVTWRCKTMPFGIPNLGA